MVCSAALSDEFTARQAEFHAFPFHEGATALGICWDFDGLGDFISKVKESLALVRYRRVAPHGFFPNSPRFITPSLPPPPPPPLCPSPLNAPEDNKLHPAPSHPDARMQPPRYIIPCISPRPVCTGGNKRPMAAVGLNHNCVLVSWYDDAKYKCRFPRMTDGCTLDDLLSHELESAIVQQLCGYAGGPRFSELDELVDALQLAGELRFGNARNAAAAASRAVSKKTELYYKIRLYDVRNAESYHVIGSWCRTMVLCLCISAVLADVCNLGLLTPESVSGGFVRRIDDRFAPVLEYMCRMLAQLDVTREYRVRGMSTDDSALFYSIGEMVTQRAAGGLDDLDTEFGARALMLLSRRAQRATLSSTPPPRKRRKTREEADEDYGDLNPFVARKPRASAY